MAANGIQTHAATTRDMLWNIVTVILKRRTALTNQPSHLCVDSGTFVLMFTEHDSICFDCFGLLDLIRLDLIRYSPNPGERPQSGTRK